MIMEKRVTTITIVPKGEPIFDERGFTVSIDDEAGAWPDTHCPALCRVV